MSKQFKLLMLVVVGVSALQACQLLPFHNEKLRKQQETYGSINELLAYFHKVFTMSIETAEKELEIRQDQIKTNQCDKNRLQLGMLLIHPALSVSKEYLMPEQLLFSCLQEGKGAPPENIRHLASVLQIQLSDKSSHVQRMQALEGALKWHDPKHYQVIEKQLRESKPQHYYKLERELQLERGRSKALRRQLDELKALEQSIHKRDQDTTELTEEVSKDTLTKSTKDLKQDARGTEKDEAKPENKTKDAEKPVTKE